MNHIATTVGFVIVQILTICSFLPWLLLFFLSFFFFDAPGSEKEWFPWLLAVPIWLYPFPTIICVLVSWVLFLKRKKAEAVIAASLPLAGAALFIGIAFVIMCAEVVMG